MKRIDAHIHFPGDHQESIEFIRQLGYKLLNICVAQDSTGEWRSLFKPYRDLAKQHPGLFAW
ncbi:MAG: hypothetical protein JNM63_15585, partial [Spirochaetia bacterium]|nr:hypothetical protein [Spirochaetia bacterium]